MESLNNIQTTANLKADIVKLKCKITTFLLIHIKLNKTKKQQHTCSDQVSRAMRSIVFPWRNLTFLRKYSAPCLFEALVGYLKVHK